MLKSVPDGSVHCIVTSPPYHGVRSYLPQDHPLKHLEIGCEPTIELYLEHLIEVFDGCHRVLRDDGLLWVNMGDRMTSGGRRTYDKSLRSGSGFNNRAIGVMRPADPDGLKRKDLCMMPARLAMALQARGWYLRSMIPWIKRNAMPESADDRPANATEYIFMLSKSEHYHYDAEAVKMPVSGNAHPRFAQSESSPKNTPKSSVSALGSKQNASFAQNCSGMVSVRNRRNTDWFMESWEGLLTDVDGDPLAMIVNPKGTSIAHFAAYPSKLVEPMIKASTSDGGCCSACSANYERILVDEGPDLEHQKQCGGDDQGQYTGQAIKDYDDNGVQNASDVKRRILAGMRKKRTVGYRPACDCGVLVKPCTVLDPFGGTGQTAKVATILGRHSISIELYEEYFKSSSVNDGQGGLALL